MTDKQLDALRERLRKLVDDPNERRKLLLSALNADARRNNERVWLSRLAWERAQRRQTRLEFLLECVTELMPDMQNPGAVPMGQLIARLEPQYPDLAEQLRELS